MSNANSNDCHLAILSLKRLQLARAKLKASSRTSALLSGFAMIAMVELQITSQVPAGLLITFTACTTLLVSIHMLALMISTCILPNLEAVASISSYEHGLIAVHESPHERLRFCIELAWSFSTVFGIFLFLIELAMLCWVKLWDIQSGKRAALMATIILIPIGIIFIGFAVHFYHALVTHKFERTKQNYQELEFLVNQLSNNDNHNTSNRNEIPLNEFHHRPSSPTISLPNHQKFTSDSSPRSTNDAIVSSI
ncbi:Calcium release-activated calcium channel protein 1 [Sarcoptes scabiei]|uniref:Calcium release-activated calcium channel protein 1 n=1 Tax=Sarcoptes scabiei TaxID=52283 RepID=A0A834R393_SARSC|nr:Calcium release-activated calcium channel protein 1 [Sarcoptes scabiei]UXI14354.1 calcium release-activated calcium channel protein [Sarcoptes scabiei]